MRTRTLALVVTASLIALIARGVVEAQASRASSWTPPRAADGHPSIEGVWENNSATPLERPAQLADKPRLSDDELKALERRAREQFNPEADAVFGDGLYLALLAPAPANRGGAGTGTYAQNWLPDRYFEHRTSLIVDPPNGKLPPATPDGARARQAAVGRFARRPASAQDMSITDRCIHYGFPDLFAAYMSVYRIVQTSDYIALTLEKIHDTRIIPLDGRPHLASTMRNYLGDSRGRWEGDTLVVETTNFHPNGNPFGGYFTLSDQNLRLIDDSGASRPTRSSTRSPSTIRRCGRDRGRRSSTGSHQRATCWSTRATKATTVCPACCQRHVRTSEPGRRSGDAARWSGALPLGQTYNRANF
jgi:hypothetical protein